MKIICITIEIMTESDKRNNQHTKRNHSFLSIQIFTLIWKLSCKTELPRVQCILRNIHKACILLGFVVVRKWHIMMTSSNGTIFRVTGPLCGEFTGPGEFPAQRPVTRSYAVFFELCPNKRLSKQPRGWWFETPSWSLWRQCNVLPISFRITFVQRLSDNYIMTLLLRRVPVGIWPHRSHESTKKS